jgi:TonB family protein
MSSARTVALTLAVLSWARPLGAQPGGGGEQPPTRYDEKGRPVAAPPAAPSAERITLPEPMTYVDPEYTEEAKRAGIEGDIVLALTISATGQVLAAEVLEGLGHGLDEAAEKAARQLEFSPARLADGTPFKAVIKYRYELRRERKASAPEPVALAVLTGQVRGRDDERPLAGATITLTASAEGAAAMPPPIARAVTSDAAGRFRLAPLPPGGYELRLSAPDHDELVVREELEAGQELDGTYRLTRRTTAAGAIDITVEGERPSRSVTRRSLAQRELERIPGTSGDALRSVQSLPGVARPPVVLGALLVRGSSPFDSQTFVDGVYVPLIYHFGGLSSVVPTELLSRIDFYPGNFSARYGRAMGGIVDAGMRAPRRDRYHGMAQLDLIDARLLAEGPVPLTDGKWSFAAAGRRSYFDAWLRPVLEWAGAGVTQAPVYYDYQLLIDGEPAPGQKVRVSFYGSDDRLAILLKEPAPNEPAIAGNMGMVTGFQRLALHTESKLGGRDELSTGLALSHDGIELAMAEYFLVLEAFGVLGRAEYRHRFADEAAVNLGLDVLGGYYDVALRMPPPPQPGNPPNQPYSTRNAETYAARGTNFRPAGYLELELHPDSRTRIVPGLRLDYADDTGRLDPSPRLNARYAIIDDFPGTALKGGVGVFHQPPQFQQSMPPLGTEGLGSNRAIHYGLGVEQALTRQLGVSLEGFFKQLDQHVTGRAADTGAHVRYDNGGRGYSVGGELLLKYEPDERFFGWLAYTLSRSAIRNGPDEPEHLVAWDQTHILTVLGSYRLGHGWELGARFRLVSGNMLTPMVCDATSESCSETRVGAMFHGASGAYTAIPYGTVHSERMPPFHQLDLRVDKSWQFETWKLAAFLDVQNAYNSQNVEGLLYNYNFTRRQFVTGIPILPSIGLRGEI